MNDATAALDWRFGLQFQGCATLMVNNAVRQRWPQKAAALQPLREQTRALAVLPNDLDQVAAAAPKNVEITSVRIAPHAPDQTRKARESPAHIGIAGRKPHPHI